MPNSRNQMSGEPDLTTFVYGRHHLGKHREQTSWARQERLWSQITTGGVVLAGVLIIVIVSILASR